MSDDKRNTGIPRVILESPYRGNTKEEHARNVAYAKAALHDCLSKGEAPFASHLLYTQVLDDDDDEDRRWGIQAGWSWMATADCVVVYTDLGISNGMKLGIEEASKMGVRVEFRELLDWVIDDNA